MGAESKGDVINVDDMPEQPVEEDPEETEYGFAPLKVCVKAVWAARYALVRFFTSLFRLTRVIQVLIWRMIALENGLYTA